jgi:hypothetical protein
MRDETIHLINIGYLFMLNVLQLLSTKEGETEKKLFLKRE